MVNIISSLEKVKDIADKIKNAELNQAIADLTMSEANLKLKIAELTDENLQLKQKLSTEECYNMVFKDNAYYNIQNNKEEGPFCSCCWDNENKAIRMLNKNMMYGKIFYCHKCSCQINDRS